MSLTESLFYVGIDWAAETHAVCVLDRAGRVAAAFTITHTADGFRQLVHGLARFTEKPVEVPVGIERPDGRLVDALLEAGHPVVPVKPNAIKAWRDGEVISGAKNDAGDAQVIAEYLRLRAHPRRPRPRPGRRDQPVGCAAGPALARRQSCLRRHRVHDRAGVPHPLPHPPGR